MRKELSELYSDYLPSPSGHTTAAGLPELPDRQIGHDKTTDFLSESDSDSGDLRMPVKETVRPVGSRDGIPISDGTVGEKSRTDGNEIMTRHYDHIAFLFYLCK